MPPRRPLLTSLAFLVLTALGASARAGDVPHAAPANVPIAVAPGHQAYADISDFEDDHYIAWQDRRAGNWDIWYYDLLDGTTHQLTTDPGHQVHPGLMHEQFVWEEWKDGHYDVYWRSVTTGQQLRLALPGNQRWPEVAHDTVIFQDDRAGNWDIVRWEVGSGQVSTLAGGPGNQMSPSVRHSAIVWEDTRGGTFDVYAWDVRGRFERPIATGPGNERFPYVRGVASFSNNTVIAWQDDRDGDWDIWCYTAWDGRTIRVTDDPAQQTRPSVGRVLAWEDNRHGNWDIYATDLVATWRVTTDPADQRIPDCSRLKCAWTDFRNGNWDIFMADFEPLTGGFGGPDEGLLGDAFVVGPDDLAARETR